MQQFLSLLIPAALALGFVRLCLSQIRWIWKIALNSLAGFLSLWLLNLASGMTGLFIPVNFLTACIAGFLGLPGMILLAVLELSP